MPGKDSKTPAKGAAKGAAKPAAKPVVAKPAAKPAAPKPKIAKGKSAAKGAKKGGKGAAKGATKSKARIAKEGAKGRKGYKGNLKKQSVIKQSIVKHALRKKARAIIQKKPSAKNSNAYKIAKKRANEVDIRLNDPPTRGDAARARTLILTRARGYRNGQAPQKKIRKGADFHTKYSHLFINRPKEMGIGGSVRPKTDLKRFVKWPKYIRIQRQKRILLQRLKVPPMVNQFRKAARRNHALTLFRLLRKYKPEDSISREKRLRKLAREKALGKPLDKFKKPLSVISGIHHVTQLVFSKQAKLVLIASDVDPIEIVLWLPTLCRKMDVPYMIVRGKARMGTLVNMKTCTTLAVTGVKKEHEKELNNYIKIARKKFNDNLEVRKRWGGLKLGAKSRARIAKQKRMIKTEAALRSKAENDKRKSK